MNEVTDGIFAAYQDDAGHLVVDVFDEPTGELVPTPINQLGEERQMASLAHAIIASRLEYQQQMKQIGEKKVALDILSQSLTVKHQQREDAMVNLAAGCLSSLDTQNLVPKDKQDRPYYKVVGAGKFAELVTQRTALDATAWNEMTDEAKKSAAQSSWAGEAVKLVVTETVKVDRVAVLKQLQSGASLHGFGIITAKTGIVFKKETANKPIMEGGKN